MAGVSSATLEAWSIPVVGGAGSDHTYVVSSCGLRWGCRGRSYGGICLRSGVGSSVIADCLSQPNSEAGIRYGLTGVCHQMANRILHPAGITVAGCGGYLVSVFAFGELGSPNPWPELSACYAGGTVPAGAGGSVGVGRSGNLSGSISAHGTPQFSVEVTQLAEFLALTEKALGGPLDNRTRGSVRRIQKDFLRHKTRLVRNLDLEIVTPDEYLRQFNGLLSATMEQMRVTLGDERFRIVFGNAGRHPEGLVDRSTFMDAIASERAAVR